MEQKARISRELTQFMQELYMQGAPIKDIARYLGISYGTVHHHTRLEEGHFLSPQEYAMQLIAERGFKSEKEYAYYLAQRRGYSSPYRYQESLAILNGHKSTTDYLKKQAEKRGSTRRKDRIFGIKRRGYKSVDDYENHQAQKRGFSTYHILLKAQKAGCKTEQEYRRHVIKNRRIKSADPRGRFIAQTLYELGKDQTWLANQMEVSRQSVCNYIAGRQWPEERRTKELCKILNILPEQLEALVKN